MTIVLQQ